ncbi:MAG: TetR/AcrR family transcriptional regulator, partial [Mycobacteriaceae bacterium]|nr:TetR/AcrR family transcriptional regulator [Mycobacteriaceae bacterium]
GDDRELAILQTAELLLQERALTEISVDDLAKGAGISRPTFYFYFPSKEAVLLTLLDRVVQQVDAAIEALTAELPSDPARVWSAIITGVFEAFGSQRWVGRNGLALLANRGEMRQMWLALLQKWIDQTALSINAERARGAAPETIPAEDLAVTLNLMNERAMMAVFSAEQPAVPYEHVVETLTHIWLTSIYGSPPG